MHHKTLKHPLEQSLVDIINDDIQRKNATYLPAHKINDKNTPGGGTPRKIGVCGPLPKTLTLFMTKICDFPYPIYDLTKNLIPYLCPDP